MIAILIVVGGGMGLAGVALEGTARVWLRNRLAAQAQTVPPDRAETLLANLADWDDEGLAAVARLMIDADPVRRNAAARTLRPRVVRWRADPNSSNRTKMTIVLAALAAVTDRLPPTEAALAREWAEEALEWPAQASDAPLTMACERILLDPFWSATGGSDSVASAPPSVSTRGSQDAPRNAERGVEFQASRSDQWPAEMFRPPTLGPPESRTPIARDSEGEAVRR